MATYKVLQDIEAEDTLIGPLTLRQCIYAAIAAICVYLSVVAVTRGAPWLVFLFLPFIGFGVFFAFPWRKEQSTEVWALARIRFALKPRKRIWDQSGIKELVTVTAPQQLLDPRLARHMSETEVRGRLKALADTIDSRGWAVKNVPLAAYVQPSNMMASDRLVEPGSLPQEVPTIDASREDDMFDLATNPLAQQFDAKMTASSNAHHQQLIQQFSNPVPQSPAAPAGMSTPQNWYMTQPQTAAPALGMSAPLTVGGLPDGSPAIVPGIPIAANPTPQELALAEDIRHRQELLKGSEHTNLRVIQPLSAQAAAAPIIAAPAQAAAPVTPPQNPAILELANNNDLNVATLAREAKLRSSESSDEVVVSLH